MATRKTLNFLPNIFRTDINKKFLGSTLDHLVSEPLLLPLNGFAGRKFSRTYPTDTRYFTEETKERQNYQFEPSVVIKNKNSVELHCDYTDLLSKIKYFGGNTSNHNRLFQTEYYSYDPRIDFDKFVNYSEYYWLPEGPDAVVVSSGYDISEKVYDITRTSTGYTSNITGNIINPEINLFRGVTYKFELDQIGHKFYIQTEPGLTGKKQFSQNVTTRTISGLTGNNGVESGTITFTPPSIDSQDYYFNLPYIDYVDYATTQAFSEIDGKEWKDGLTPVNDIDGDSNFPNGKYVVFLSNINDNTLWVDKLGNYVPLEQRKSIWQINISSTSVVTLQHVRDIPIGYILKINGGTTYKCFDFFKDTDGNLVVSPAVTAAYNTLYYQDATENNFFGKINILEPISGVINVTTDILGKTSYTSPRGIQFSNGMKIRFDSSVFPIEFQNKTYIVEGVGTGITLVDYDLLQIIEKEDPLLRYVNFDTEHFDIGTFDQVTEVSSSTDPEYIVMHRASQDLNAWSRLNRWVHQDVLLKTAEINKTNIDFEFIYRAQRPIIEFKPNLQLFNSGRIFLSFVDRFDEYLTTSGAQSSWVKISDAFSQINNNSIRDTNLGALKYIEGQTVVFPMDVDTTVKSKIYRIQFKDLSNETIFDQVGTGTLTYSNNSRFVLGVGGNTNFISEITVGSQLYNSTGVYIGKVKNVFNNSRLELETNATHTNNSTVFSINYPIIELLEINTAQSYDNIVIKSGRSKKFTYWFNGTNWILSQQKISKNQFIQFDVIDRQDNSFGSNKYQDSNFIGNKIISYKLGSGGIDKILNLNLSYSGIGNTISDINFENNFDSASFTFTEVSTPTTLKINSGHLRLNLGRYNYQPLTVWQTANEQTKQYQHFSITIEEPTLFLNIDITPDQNVNEKNIKIFLNNSIIEQNLFELSNNGITNQIEIFQPLEPSDKIDILIYSKTQTSTDAYYEIPSNLEFNPLNQNFSTISLGQFRNHFSRIIENSNTQSNFSIRDFNLSGVPGTILQHSGSITLAATFLTDKELNFVNSIDYTRREYTKFKNKFIDLATKLDLNLQDIPNSVDTILKNINAVKTVNSPWFYSDMIPMGEEFIVDSFKIINSSLKTYNLRNIYQDFGNTLYDVNQPTNKSILVYLNNQLLIIGVDYTFTASSSAITLSESLTLTNGDILLVKGYTNTNGNFVPETPSKLGMYPKYIPTKFLDNTYRNPINVIQGHDGSITPAFEDYRDNLLLELEKRIYNNIKNNYNENLLNLIEIIPGKFRQTDYSLNEFNQVLMLDFLKWIGQNQIDYATNENFQPNDPFTWNYNQTSDRLNGDLLPGYWRNIYKYFYDTDRPHTHPWEMLGYTEKPNWWETHYGAAPYTSNNTLMWTDLSNGFSRGENSTNSKFARTNLSNFIPVNSLGQMLPPLSTVTGNFNGSKFSHSFSVGDGGPVESAWRRSSEFPYALQRAIALLKPAKYFALMFDTYNNIKDITTNQYVFRSTMQRSKLTDIKINGEISNSGTNFSNGYINWVHGYLTNLGVDATHLIRNKINNLDVNLSYKIGGYTDKKIITSLVDQYSPTSTNESVVIPDENYKIHLNKSVEKQRAVYSAVIVEKTSTGYSISGYDLENPYFTVIPNNLTGKSYSVQVLNIGVTIYQEGLDQLITVPYGFELSNIQEVADFLISYQRYLTNQGFVFENYQSDLSQVKDWVLSVREFLTWTLQNWNPGNLIVLSPVSDTLILTNNNSVVDEITNKFSATQVLNSNFKTIPLNDLTLLRDSGITTVKTLSGQTMTFIDLNLVQYEHVLIFDNTTIFNDIIYKSEIGSRQYRIKLVGSKTGEWDGSLYAPGFIYSNGLVDDWQPGRDYFKGDIVKFKDNTFVAISNVISTDEFNFNNWVLTDSEIKTGLLPNFSKNSSLSSEIYNSDSLIIDENYGNFSRGIIGFRNRTSLSNLGIDSLTQSKFYQGFIKDKGTATAIQSLYKGIFDNVKNKLDMYEEWGIRVGEYGGTNSNRNVDLILKENKFKGNPISITFGDSAAIDVVRVTKKDLYSYPQNFNNNLFLNRQQFGQVETDLMTAGYVNINDVNTQIFSLGNLSAINGQILGNLNTGYKIWVAKDFGNQWQVYKTTKTNNELVQVESALDNKLKFIFKNDHGLRHGELFAVNDFDELINGFYQVLNIEEYNTVLVAVEQTLTDQVTEPLAGQGFLYKFSEQRFNDISDRNSRIKNSDENVDDISWVDSVENKWQTFKLNQIYKNNFSSNISNWQIADGIIHIRSNSVPYHAYNTDGNLTIESKYYDRYWAYNGGTNTQPAISSNRNKGIVGFWLNGVAMYSPDRDDWVPDGYEIISDLNYNFGYANFSNLDLAQGTSYESNAYAYIGNPLKPWQNANSEISTIPYYNGSATHADGHSKIVGFSIDGYPIYGPYGYITPLDTQSGIRKMLSSYQLKLSSYRENTDAFDLNRFPMGMFIQDYEFSNNGDLDIHNGRYCKTPEYPNGTYAYFISTDGNDEPTYPYVIGNTFYGTVPEFINSRLSGLGSLPLGFGYNVDINSVWNTYQSQGNIVDLNSVESIKIYDLQTKNIVSNLDFINPSKGKILGAAQDDLDYVSDYDPARYNIGTQDGVSIDDNYHWGSDHVGLLWWDTSTVRYYDFEQFDLDYRINYWGQTFPGSVITVYEWVESNVLPESYTQVVNDGIPKFQENQAYVEEKFVDPVTGIIKTKYFYWVSKKTTVSENNKKFSVISLEQMISNPKLQNIPFAAILDNRSVALYNLDNFINDSNSVLSLGYKTFLTENSLYTEYDLVQEGNPESILNSKVENKIIDSLVGFDILNNSVPDLSLPAGTKFGLSTNPAQTVISNRLKALENILTYVNSILINYPIANRIVDKINNFSDNLYAINPVPDSMEYDDQVDNLTEFEYIATISTGNIIIGKQYVISNVGNTDFTSIGSISNNVGQVFTANAVGSGTGIVYPRRILVNKNSDYDNFWTINEKNANGSIGPMLKLQKFDTTKFWNFADWYAKDYDSTVKVNYTVSRYIDSYKLNLVIGDVVKIINNINDFEIYIYNQNGSLELIGLGNGTIQFNSNCWKQYGYDVPNYDQGLFDFDNAIEIRYIFKAIKEDLFTKDLKQFYNTFIFNIIKYILVEQQYVDWAFKTSFITLIHTIDSLSQEKKYIKDRQLYYQQYVEEVKPYKSKIREYILNYLTNENLNQLVVTDFDLPSYYDRELDIFRSPNSFKDSDDDLLSSESKYRDWFNHHKYQLGNVVISATGSGHLTPPTIRIVSNDNNVINANANTVINSAGSVTDVVITNSGENYVKTPTIAVVGTGTTVCSNLTPTLLSARLTNSKVRKIKTTLRFDRVQYSTKVLDWQTNTSYPINTYVSFEGKGYKTIANIVASNFFDVTQYTTVQASEFDNANDRIMSFYNPRSDMIPKILDRLITGIAAPEVNSENFEFDTIVAGGGFTGQTLSVTQLEANVRYIITNIDQTDFTQVGAPSNRVGIEFTATGPGTGLGTVTIAISDSAFGNINGIAADDIIVTGGTFVDEIFSRAPEELLPGRMYDTVSIKVVGNIGSQGYRRFIDINGDRITTSINTNSITNLSVPLMITDTVITVNNGSVLPEPSVMSLQPGIIHVNGERIEYYIKSGNVLGQIKRGVGGTAIAIEHKAGSTVESAADELASLTQ